MTALDDRQLTVTKRCRKCNEEKSVDQFYKNGRSGDGYGYYCKPCDSAKRSINYHEGKHGIKIRNRADRFIAGLVDPAELTYDELVGGYILLEDGTKYWSVDFDKRSSTRFATELTKRLNRMIKEKASRSIEIIFDIADSDLVEPADRLKAATWLAERVIGKTPEKIELKLESAPYEEIEANIGGGSREAHRAKAIGSAIDAEIIDVDDEPYDEISEVESEASELLVDDVSEQQVVVEQSEQHLVRSRRVDSSDDANSAESVADAKVDKKQAAQDLKKRVAEAKKRRYAARAVGATSLDAVGWKIDWRVTQEGLRACLVPPVAFTPDRLTTIRINDEQTDNPQFIAQQRINQLEREAQLLLAQADKLGINNGTK